jgi:hypothetical protein
VDRRDFLWVGASAGMGVAVAGATSVFSGGPVAVDAQKGGGRALIAEPVTARVSSGSFPFALSRFAEDPTFTAAPKQMAGSTTQSVLAPIREVSFHGFGSGAGVFTNDHVQVVAVHHGSGGAIARHDLWSHAPTRLGGTSQSVLFSAHELAFGGFEFTHVPALGARSSGLFAFAASGSGPQLLPGVYVLAGPSAATGVAPDLGRYGYSGDRHAPVRASRALGLDFTYLSFVVHGEWA